MRRRAALLLTVVGTLGGCWSDRSPGKVAQRFLDKYYLEVDQPAALQLCDGAAASRIQVEIADLQAARRQGLESSPAHPNMYYRPIDERPAADLAQRDLNYELTIDSQGVMLHKRVNLVLENEAGHWRIVNFAEADMARINGLGN